MVWVSVGPICYQRPQTVLSIAPLPSEEPQWLSPGFTIQSLDLHPQPCSHTKAFTFRLIHSWLCQSVVLSGILCYAQPPSQCILLVFPLWRLPLPSLPSEAAILLNPAALSPPANAQGATWFSTYHFLIILRVFIVCLTIKGKKISAAGRVCLEGSFGPMEGSVMLNSLEKENYEQISRTWPDVQRLTCHLGTFLTIIWYIGLLFLFLFCYFIITLFYVVIKIKVKLPSGQGNYQSRQINCTFPFRYKIFFLLNVAWEFRKIFLSLNFFN